MSTILHHHLLILIFGGGGGYYAHSYYGAPGLGGVLGIVLLSCIVLWLMGRSPDPGARRGASAAAPSNAPSGSRRATWANGRQAVARLARDFAVALVAAMRRCGRVAEREGRRSPDSASRER